MILNGPLKNAVSLGVYSNKARAARRAARLEGLGYSVVSEANTKVVDEFVTIEARVSGAYAALGAAWKSQFPNESLQDVDCR